MAAFRLPRDGSLIEMLLTWALGLVAPWRVRQVNSNRRITLHHPFS